jgi:GNAT superfamily N-acetyltransferase
MPTLEVVRTRSDRQLFVRLARDLYPADSPWVRPLDSVVLDYLDQRGNPFYGDGEGMAFLVLQDGKAVGRILAHVWNRHRRLHGERVGYFGFFECVDDLDAAAQLLGAAADFARGRGCTLVRGPFNMTAAQEMGIVLDGFDEAPAADMVFTPTYYPRLFEASGFRPCLTMRTWRNDDVASIDPDAMLTPRHRDLYQQIDLKIRPIHPRERREHLEVVRELVNSAFLGNWGFVPITREEWDFQIGPVVPLLDPDLVLIAEVRGVPVGVTFATPDFNRVLKRMNGRLIHPSALSLVRRHPTDAAVVILFAIRKSYQGLGVSRALNAELVRALKRGGYRSLAVTWIASDNHASQAQVRALGMQRLHELAMFERLV